MKTFVISGLTSCGSSTIGKLLADKLALKYFSIGKEFKKRGEGAGETDKNINFTNYYILNMIILLNFTL